MFDCSDRQPSKKLCPIPAKPWKSSNNSIDFITEKTSRKRSSSVKEGKLK